MNGGARGPAAIALVVAALATTTATACRRPGVPPAAPTAPVAPASARGFSHARHRGIPCTQCHSVQAVLRGRPAMPGADDHAPCDRAHCHRAAFLTTPGKLCKVCHTSVNPTLAGASPLRPFPPRQGPRILASSFSHKRHLDFARMEAQVGFHVSCTDCHRLRADGRFSAADHRACARCHAPEAAPPGAPTMNQCTACHRARAHPPTRARRLIVGDLHFSHRDHLTDQRGAHISCAECHRRSAESTHVGRHPLPTTRACEACHDNPSRVPSTMRMTACQTCHTMRLAGLHRLPPRSHLPALRRPEDHTLAFRRDHATEARRDAARCARCHTFMSGSSRGSCDECHRVMRPSDHTVTWTEYDHGPAAATDSQRCAVCHVGEFCTACHSQPPRSHFPLTAYADGGHATDARLNPRACVTCHVVARDCARSGCHAVAGQVR